MDSLHFIFTSCLMVKNTQSDIFLLCYIVLAKGSVKVDFDGSILPCVVNISTWRGHR